MGGCWRLFGNFKAAETQIGDGSQLGTAGMGLWDAHLSNNSHVEARSECSEVEVSGSRRRLAAIEVLATMSMVNPFGMGSSKGWFPTGRMGLVAACI
ncbi:hypothetical protein CASFOL_001737 [Castilleja foliolosa]|uniref:Uncharacterized protein n=1 Tax=Castilleja foliolosa TaxID=1961234 RepID=A0ABD3ECE0_9LAMI